MTRYGFVASGGGYRSFYTAGVLVWLKQHQQSVVHLSSTSSGNNIVIDYLLWDWQNEDLPPVLTRTINAHATACRRWAHPFRCSKRLRHREVHPLELPSTQHRSVSTT